MEEIASTIKIASVTPVVAEAKVSKEVIEKIDEIELKVRPSKVNEDSLEWYGADALFAIESLWELIQKTQGISQTLAQKYGKVWSALRKTYSTLQVKKIRPDAIIPSKAHPLDSGFDISVVHIVKREFGPGVILYGTGLVVRPPDGYYIDLVARSSLCKAGWMIANCVGIIDAQYRGELCVSLTKIHGNAKPLELPARIGQIIIRELHVCDVEEVDEICSTQRGAGGFGSSGK
jgi:deoxyuridine 5'-triphosphate nucleotidohydrolase